MFPGDLCKDLRAIQGFELPSLYSGMTKILDIWDPENSDVPQETVLTDKFTLKLNLTVKQAEPFTVTRTYLVIFNKRKLQVGQSSPRYKLLLLSKKILDDNEKVLLQFERWPRTTPVLNRLRNENKYLDIKILTNED